MSDIVEVLEPLEKKCPRCGAQTSGKAERCAKHKKQLRDNKKKPGHWQRAQTKADDALRRQKGKNGTASKKSSGLGSRKSIVKQTQAAEKKTGEKLSPDRKNNSKGYAAKNTRMVPEKLNRGRHHVDPKKLRAWKKKLKKSEIDTASLYTLMKAKYANDYEITELLKSVGPDGLEQYIELFDIEEPLEKDAKVLSWVSNAKPADREAIPKLEGPLRAKGIQHIANNTQSRVNPKSKGKEFLMHRAMSHKELGGHKEGQVTNKTSWTPKIWQASVHMPSEDTPHDDHHLVSAWIPEEHIHHIPSMTENNEVANQEHEAIVNPHSINFHKIYPAGAVDDGE